MPLPPLGDTIAAIATAPGVGAVGIVRLSGPESYAVAERLFAPRSGAPVAALPPGRVVYGRIVDAATDETVDEALLLTFRAPHSYTGEDVLELQTHGGPAVLRRVLDLCTAHGARLAGPGEFTLRAFLSGRLDLVQAEAVLDLVNAQSDSARRNAALGLSKALTEQLGLIQDDITRVYGDIQAVFDYPDEGVPEAAFQAPLERALGRVRGLLSTARAGRVAQRGARLALIGRPNAGKSSLLNALLGYRRSIVSSTPGTTRDYLEAPVDILGVPVTAVDTAGIRDTGDAVEASGVEAAKEIAEHADLGLLLLDSSTPLAPDDRALVGELSPARLLVVASKSDLPPAWDPCAAQRELGVGPVLRVSAATGEGLGALKEAIRERLVGDAGGSALWLTNERHIAALEAVREHLERAKAAPDDLAALDLEDALKTLGELTGRGEVAEETLAHIFANFCVGK
ncbi:tRNA uridine-5-carboxymethylaminomethyl(34) synthesis GTPase MnmE [Truepera radiovictrix]|uniref:tRNA modification GTPase MnmE n=1 Tax=Truepera radiovictrix (strain DSM 17093 / CIP 108686 / LMG 22925 / RQ-24) TaxID=649638 RepID=D7CW51_TRURR|nr:tRNA uridine-5-carboxymethylaminomethyl(34) synthesis GTPase MnmE [Truepera radiovictrix]ADI14314.1 tRNA modification GTPase TrmE [Truepera radiovictrix DSM 17093]WMT57130.1 tRNA uridine-5-carboxymethylaminomethyl(34) synthesis GTPase MnmE [Truepera radiovictrix]